MPLYTHLGKLLASGAGLAGSEDCCCGEVYGLYSCCAPDSPPFWTTTEPFKRPGDIPGGNVELVDLEGKVVKNIFLGTAETPEPVCGCYTVSKITNADHLSRPRVDVFYEPDDTEHPSDLDAGPCETCEECPPDACGDFCLAVEPPTISVTVTTGEEDCDYRDELGDPLTYQTGSWSDVQMDFSYGGGGAITGYTVVVNEHEPRVTASFSCATRKWTIGYTDDRFDNVFGWMVRCPPPMFFEAEGTPCSIDEPLVETGDVNCVAISATVTPSGDEGCEWNGKCLYFPPAGECGGPCDEDELGDCPTTEGI